MNVPNWVRAQEHRLAACGPCFAVLCRLFEVSPLPTGSCLVQIHDNPSHPCTMNRMPPPSFSHNDSMYVRREHLSWKHRSYAKPELSMGVGIKSSRFDATVTTSQSPVSERDVYR